MSYKVKMVRGVFSSFAGFLTVASVSALAWLPLAVQADDGGFGDLVKGFLGSEDKSSVASDGSVARPKLQIQAQVTQFGGSGVIAKVVLGDLEFNSNQVVELETGKHYVGEVSYLMITHNPEARQLYTENLDFIADWSGDEVMKVQLKKFQFRGSLELPQGLKMQFAEVLPGKFLMGEKSFRHNVTLTKTYWISKYEVTQAQYEALMGNNPSAVIGPNLPVEQVSWTAALAFCKRLTEYEANAGRLPEGYEYSLPTEAQWEFAARGGMYSQNYKYSGSNTAGDVAWYHENSGEEPLSDVAWNYRKVIENKNSTHPVGAKMPNELGIYDMSGNVSEWCYDSFNWYCNDDRDPVSTSKSEYRVFRGGAFDEFAWRSGVGYRNRYYTYSRNSNVGFRVVLTPIRNDIQQKATAVLLRNDVSTIPMEFK